MHLLRIDMTDSCMSFIVILIHLELNERRRKKRKKNNNNNTIKRKKIIIRYSNWNEEMILIKNLILNNLTYIYQFT